MTGLGLVLAVSLALSGCDSVAMPGRITVSNREVRTEIPVKAGSSVRLEAAGTVDLGGGFIGIGASKLTADGDDRPTPADYPAPHLRKNSLIAKVGSRWYQGGQDRTLEPTEDGELILAPNDAEMADNSRGWLVKVTVLPPTASGPGPYGPLVISNTEVSTTIEIKAGSSVRTQADGILDVGGAPFLIDAPKLNADGDDTATPSDYPAPNLRKNSLIAKVGSRWYQGGQDRTFMPTEDGELVLRPNDSELTDNSRVWQVTVTVIPPPGASAPRKYGPVVISNAEVHTAIHINAGSSVRTQATGILDLGGAFFGIGAPKLSADGDDSATPSSYPAPALRKNSLIVKIGSNWYQGGQDRTFVATEDGELILRPNDADLADNSRGWQVTLIVTTP